MTKLVWSTPNGDDLIAKIARVSNPSNEDNTETAPRLIAYLIKHKHWSPFEMVSACVEIETTRDIGRQILRHRSFSFQEFSQRYAAVPDSPELKDLRLQDVKNRQNSIPTDDVELSRLWSKLQWETWLRSVSNYKEALDRGIAKELARALLPEGLTKTRLYMAGNLRSWIHYFQVRTEAGTQAEHREIATKIMFLLAEEFPDTFKAFGEDNGTE